jgi:peptidyl-prolyl cis-trans isomerase B (cyclophilin B)
MDGRISCFGFWMLLLLTACGPSEPAPETSSHRVAVLETPEGNIVIRLRFDAAPANALNFMRLCESGAFDRTTFHRVAPGYLIQGGDPDSRDQDPANDGFGGSSWDGRPLPLEKGLLSHLRGTVSTASTLTSGETGSQFFILLADDPSLDGRFSAFGEVIEGIEAAERIAARPGDPYPPDAGGFRPRTPVPLERCRIDSTPLSPTPEERDEDRPTPPAETAS